MLTAVTIATAVRHYYRVMQELTLQRDILPQRDKLYRLALGITLHTAEAEDVVQDTMLQAWRHRDEWPQIANMEAWLTQICRRLALDRRQRMDRMTLMGDEQQAETASTKQPPATDNRYEQRERYNTVFQLMNSLPSPQSEIMRLRDIEGMSYRDIAAQLNITEDQVKVYLFRARQRVRQEYSKIEGYGL